VEERGWQFVLWPFSSGGLAAGLMVLALDRKCRQRRDGTRDGCAEDILKVSQHKKYI
jgi:hypothetical protein